MKLLATMLYPVEDAFSRRTDGILERREEDSSVSGFLNLIKPSAFLAMRSNLLNFANTLFQNFV